VAALLSFEEENKNALIESEIIMKILRAGIFKAVLSTLKNEKIFSASSSMKTFYDKPWLQHFNYEKGLAN